MEIEKEIGCDQISLKLTYLNIPDSFLLSFLLKRNKFKEIFAEISTNFMFSVEKIELMLWDIQ